LDPVEVGAAPGAVGGERLDACATAGEVEGEVGEDLSFAAGGVGGKVDESEDDAVVG
jgi:hypothetical protein